MLHFWQTNIREKICGASVDDLIFVFICVTYFLLPTGTAPPIIAFSIALTIWIFSGRFLKSVDIIKKSWFWPVILFIILPWIGMLYSQNTDLGMDYAEKTKYWLAAIIIASIRMDEKRMEWVVNCLWAGLAMGGILAVLQLIGIIPVIKPDFLGFGIVYTLLDMYLIVGILMASIQFKSISKLSHKILMVALGLLFLFHLAVLKGRAGYLILILIAPAIAGNLMSRFSTKFKVILPVLLVAAFLLVPSVRDRLNGTLANVIKHKDKALRGEYVGDLPRFYIYHQTVDTIKNHPWIGIGSGSLSVVTKAKGHRVDHPHNNVLYMWVSFGILGVFSCLWLFWEMLKRSWRQRQTVMGYFILSSCVVLFLGGMFDTQILNTGTLLFLSLTYGLLNHMPDKADRNCARGECP